MDNSIAERISKNAAIINLKEIRLKGVVCFANPNAIAEKIKRFTGADVEVDEEYGTVQIKSALNKIKK